MNAKQLLKLLKEDNKDAENDKAAKKYIIRDREAGNFIDEFDTLEEAQKELERYEQMDKDDGCYTPDFYEIVESEG